MKKIIISLLLLTTIFTIWLNQSKNEVYAYFTTNDTYFIGEVTYSSNDSIFFESASNSFLNLKSALTSYIGFGDLNNTEVIVSYSFVPANIMIDDFQLRDVINITTIISFYEPLYFAEFDIFFYDTFNKLILALHYNNVADLNNMAFDSIVINSVTGTYAQGYYEGYGEGYGEGFDAGKDVGLNISQQEAYDSGYIDGSNKSFLASIKDWIVPAIIVVLFLGGAVSLILRKREG